MLLEENEWDILLEKDQVSTTPHGTEFFRCATVLYYYCSENAEKLLVVFARKICR